MVWILHIFGGTAMKKLAIAIGAIALIGTPAFAADMAVKARPPAPAPVYSWTGWYVGGNVGYGWGQNQSVTFSDVNGPLVSNNVGIPAPISFNASGALGGFQLGYNWQFNQAWLAGFETDFNFSDIDGSGASNNLSVAPFCSGNLPCPLVATANERLDWFGTVRGRLGYLPTNNVLLYGTAGFAYGRLKQSVQYINVSAAGNNSLPGNDGTCPAASTCFAGTSNRTATGWTAGAGFEYALLNNWTFKVEYLYVDLGSNTFNEGVLFPEIIPPHSQTASLTAHYDDFAFHVVRGGFNYKFY
jgi:outer membrane immunogenic protein